MMAMTNKEAIFTLGKLEVDLAATRARMRHIVENTFRVNAEVNWRRGRSHRQSGVVVTIGCLADRLKVRNYVTGCEYWIDVGNLVE